MSDRARNLQRYLNMRGAKLVVDGAWGPATRAAVVEVHRNANAPAATNADMHQIAVRLGCTTRQLAAVAKVEGGGAGWDNAGRLKLLWERHYLWRRVKLAVPFLSEPKPGGYTVDADGDGINDSWEKLADATGRFGFDTAAECASVGKFQIMGAHWKALGYLSVADFYWQLSRSEAAHYDAFARFIQTNKLEAALRQIDGNPANCLSFARGYNGKDQQGYDARIAAAWRVMGPAPGVYREDQL